MHEMTPQQVASPQWFLSVLASVPVMSALVSNPMAVRLDLCEKHAERVVLAAAEPEKLVLLGAIVLLATVPS